MFENGRKRGLSTRWVDVSLSSAKLAKQKIILKTDALRSKIDLTEIEERI